MEFRTVIRPLEGRQGLVGHGEPMLLLGSCFSDNIGECLCNDLFDVEVNPFGAVYNPVSIRDSLLRLKEGDPVESESLFEREGLFHSFMFHSKYSGMDRDVTAMSMSERIARVHGLMHRLKVAVLTLGTTRTFTHRKSGRVVANCHKLPGSEFDVTYMRLDEATDALACCVEMLRDCNPDVHVVFTVSPLRYTEQGAHGNQLAKSTLLLAVDRVIDRFGPELTSYFPAYEIMMDDLRDYRFYADDMKHPSAKAVSYIYGLFCDSYFTDETMKTAVEARALTRRLSHRIMSQSDLAARHEIEAKKAAMESLIERYPKLTDACKRYNNTLFD